MLSCRSSPAIPGRDLRRLNDKLGPVFESQTVTLKGLFKKSLDVGLKLPPSLIRCPLIHIDLLLTMTMLIEHVTTSVSPPVLPQETLCIFIRNAVGRNDD